jgi:hypothetical protein
VLDVGHRRVDAREAFTPRSATQSAAPDATMPCGRGPAGSGIDVMTPVPRSSRPTVSSERPVNQTAPSPPTP